ncbi:MAG TPA: LCP family protein [Candidatus Elarobacter sp.]|nr:LCP family protein [Candidatus Elarobacter sp.]HEV2738538.1 LCP family protein [Candidatus Elarobacter sp.]
MSERIVADPPVPPAPPAGDRPRRRSDPPPGGPPPSRWRRILAYLLALILIVVGVVCGFVAYRVLHDHQSPPDALGGIFIPSPSSVFGRDRIYVMLLGTDYNRDDKGMPYSKGARSDTIMVAGLDFPSRSLKLVSILRDTDAMVNGHETKINEAYSQGGVKLADAVIGDFVGLPRGAKGTSFDRYIVVNARGLKDFVDAIGGIDVPVTETMDYDDSWGQLHIHFKPGLQHMNGQHAMEYSRFRHDACSDVCRTRRQQQIIHITMTKLKAQKFNDLLHIGALLGALNKNVKTNMSFDEEKSLAWHFRDANLADMLKADTIEYQTAKDTPSGGEVVMPDPAQKAKVIGAFLGPYGNVTPPPLSALRSIKPSTVHVVVQNGSGVPGLAGVVSAKLEKLHYVVDSVGNADTFGYDVTQIRPVTALPYLGERVRADLGVPAAAIAPATDTTPGPHTAVTVIVGKDYATATASAAPTSSVAPAH